MISPGFWQVRTNIILLPYVFVGSWKGNHIHFLKLTCWIFPHTPNKKTLSAKINLGIRIYIVSICCQYNNTSWWLLGVAYSLYLLAFMFKWLISENLAQQTKTMKGPTFWVRFFFFFPTLHFLRCSLHGARVLFFTPSPLLPVFSHTDTSPDRSLYLMYIWHGQCKNN